MLKPRVAFVGPMERVLSLKALAMLENLSADELTAIAQHAHERSFPKGAQLIDPRKPASAAYVVLSGTVIVKRPHGEEIVNPNESVGFVDLLAQSVTGLDARAETDTQTLELDWEAQLDVCEQYFTILLQYIRYLSERGITQLPVTPERGPLHRKNTFDDLNRSLNIVERSLIFQQSEIFASCSPDARWELTRHMEETKFAKGETIWDVGEPANSFHLVANGSIGCDDQSGKQYIAPGGSTIGMYEAMSTEVRWYRATSLAPTTVLSIDRDSFLDILEDHFDMAIEYTAAIARHVLDLGQERTDSTLPRQ